MALKKKFIDIEIPVIEDAVRVLGTPEELDGRTLKLDLSKKSRGKGIEVTFKIFNEENKLKAHPKKIQLLKSYIRRMMRTGTNYVEDSFKTNSKDTSVTIKPFLITRKKVSRAVRRNLRNTAKEFLINYVQEKDYLQLCDEILNGDLQRELLPKLKKVYPLSFCDLRVFESNDMEKINKEFVKREPVAREERKIEEKTQAEEIEEELAKQKAETDSEEKTQAEEIEEETEKKAKKTTKKKATKKAKKKTSKKSTKKTSKKEA